ncbi:tuberin isoform X2 [Toxorhynchites rutilus septentrionalis]|uniref:tuberin isoform X2 n=1 Tax=Toxorhynchites rutilus septentrionalis TaxID=329112 RepID=UPI0024783CB2|nr:tuberin isoform X2 [Toxorhynchites rutilus septentrionalis]
MSSKDKDNALNKLKQFFRNSRTSGTMHRDRSFICITPDLERELQPETPVGQRCKVLKDFSDDVLKYRLEKNAVQSLWQLTKDLIVNKSTEQRHVALNFYCKLIQGQYDNLHLMRSQFFRVIVTHDEPEDIAYRLEMLKSLTENGKNIQYFEREIGSFIVQWIPQIDKAGLIVSLLDLIVNLVKYNAASLEKNFQVGIVHYIFDITCKVEDNQTILRCLSVLDCFICYAIVPNETLTLFIVILCRTVNRESYCTTSWKIMKNLFGTALGHATLLTMCSILNDKTFYKDEALLRGAIFHTNVGLWGVSGTPLPVLNSSPSIVLSSFLNALRCEHVVVTYEVILSIHRLIQKIGSDLNEPTWDIICDIMVMISSNLAKYRLPAENYVVKHFHDTLDLIEEQQGRDEIKADPEKIFGLIEKVSSERSEASVRRLIEYMTTKISATRPQWLLELCSFMDRFYKMPNTMIRIYAVQALVRIMTTNRTIYEEEILERIVLVHFGGVIHETDPEVRAVVASALIDFVMHCDTKRCIELLDIIGKMLHRPYECYVQDRIIVNSPRDVEDIIVLVDGLIKVFTVKLYRLPSTHAIRVYHLLMRLLEAHYEKPSVFQNVYIVRYKIFSWMLKARANASFHIGYPDPDNGYKIRFSHYLGIEGQYQHQSMQPQQQSIQQTSSSSQINLSQENVKMSESSQSSNLTTLSIKRGCQIIVDCLKEEKDWLVIQLVLSELPNILENKALIQGNDVESLARALFRMYNDRMLVEKLLFYQNKPTQSDIYDLVLPALASLASYHQHLESATKKNIIDALKQGLISRKPQVCIQTLTVLLLEMPDPLVSKLNDLLFELSKMTTTTTVAVPVLEFLSTLSHLPSDRIANFRVVEYMYVLAMSFPYTNPYRYDHYTVSLAHHVIAGWFLKCRLPMRKNLVYYIVKGFESYVHTPFQDGSKPRPEASQANEDSSNRKRSSSLTEQGSKRRSASDRASMQQQQQQQHPNSQQRSSRPQFNSDLYHFHSELAETCIDFMANHTFSPCSGLAKRSPAAEFLLRGGQSNTWLVGHNLITITTSGCSAIPLRNGLCDRCYTMCKESNIKSEPSTASTGLPLSPESSIPGSSNTTAAENHSVNKRYTKASLQHSSTNESDSTDLTTSSTSSSTTATPFPQTAAANNRFFRQGSQEATYASASLDTPARRGSNPEAAENEPASGTEHMQQTGSTAAVTRSESTLMTTLGNKLILPQHLNSATNSGGVVIDNVNDKPIQLCACSCTGWAEICIRRPTGVLSWMMRVQNQINYDASAGEFPLQDLTTLFVPNIGGGMIGADFFSRTQQNMSNPITSTASFNTEEADGISAQVLVPSAGSHKAKVSISDEVFEIRKSDESSDMGDDDGSEDAIAVTGTGGTGPIDIPRYGKYDDNENGIADAARNDEEDVAFDDPEGRSRNPVRRVNSSPEMSSNWKSQFMSKVNKEGLVGCEGSDNVTENEGQQKKKNYGKGVSCEAIPEEIAGSTPPSGTKPVTSNETMNSSYTVRASSNVKQQGEFHKTTNTLHPSASLPESGGPEASSSGIPRKQHSADDALPARLDAGGSSAEANASPTAMLPIAQTLSSTSLNLKLPVEKIATKPPHSPAPLSPRLLARNLANGKLSNSGTASPAFPNISGGGIGPSTNSNENDIPRGRSKTISVAREHYSRDNLKWGYNKATNASRLRAEQPGGGSISRSVISPSFVFLQLYHSGQLNSTEKPILMTKASSERAIHLLDLIAPFEKHKIGVLYVGPGQAGNQTEILKNRFGSLRYAKFLKKLGTLVAIKEAKEHNFFIDLECSGKDGNFTYIWQDDIVQVTFHVATLMPNHKHDPNCNEKKKHIGNDFVTIVYNESGEEYDLRTIKGQFNYACVVIEPMELESNRIFMLARDEIAQHVRSKPKVISDASAPLLARQMALHANLASLVSQSLERKNQSPYASNWLERLRKIKSIRAKELSNMDSHEQTGGGGGGSRSAGGSVGSAQDLNTSSTTRGDDFTIYTQ